MLPKPTRRSQVTQSKQQRPRSRTLTAVHEAMLEDVCFPAEIVGKRTNHSAGPTQLLKVHLNQSRQTDVEYKVITFIAQPMLPFGKNDCNRFL